LLNSIKSTAVKINKTNNKTGARDKYLTKKFCCINQAPVDEWILDFRFWILDFGF
jgi:hypothetical protein